jgi:Ca-activated chloride channel family protein
MACALSVWVCLVAGADTRQRFASGVEAVRVDVLVTDGGRPVTGLTAADFEVRDNGVLQHVSVISFERIPLNVVLVLDLSASVEGERLTDLRRAGRELMGHLSADDRAAFVGFSHAVLLGSALTKDRQPILAALEHAKPYGETALIDATYTGMIMGESDAGRALVMVFSDGRDIASWLTPARVLDAAKRSDTVVYGISMKGSRPQFLEDITSQTGGRLLDVDSRNLSSTFLSVLNEFRERYVLTYSPQGVERQGWHALEVRVKRKAASVKARPGYLAGRQPG